MELAMLWKLTAQYICMVSIHFTPKSTLLSLIIAQLFKISIIFFGNEFILQHLCDDVQKCSKTHTCVFSHCWCEFHQTTLLSDAQKANNLFMFHTALTQWYSISNACERELIMIPTYLKSMIKMIDYELNTLMAYCKTVVTSLLMHNS